MDEYIKRDKAIDALRRRLCPNTSPAQKDMIQRATIDIRGIKAADVAPVVHGRWIDNSWGDYIKVCSNCGKEPLAEPPIKSPCYSRFCPNCGAKMDGEDR